MNNKQMLLRLPRELAGRVERLAADLHQPRNHIVTEAVMFYLAERADLDVALDRLRDPNAAWVPHRDAKRELLGD
ncbi:MAG: ribbon-helix-helix protein, CopG family [bacterium]